MPDYAEILRLYRKYRARDDEPLWVTFVLLGQQMERIEARPGVAVTSQQSNTPGA